MHASTLSEDSYQRIAATGGYASISTESEDSAGQGYSPTWTLRKYGIPVSLSMDTSVWWSADLFSAMRATLNADRAREHLEAHARNETVMLNHLRAEQVVGWATMGGAQALGMDSLIGSITPGKKADLVLIKNDELASDVPDPSPLWARRLPGGARRRAYRHGGWQGRQIRPSPARRLISPRPGQPSARRLNLSASKMGEDAWANGMVREQAKVESLANPYKY